MVNLWGELEGILHQIGEKLMAPPTVAAVQPFFLSWASFLLQENYLMHYIYKILDMFLRCLVLLRVQYPG